MQDIKVHKNDYTISTDRSKLNIEMIHDYLSTESYWCNNVPIETVKRSIANSLNFGVYYKDEQIGFARVVTDYATVAYLGDVFILEKFRGQGLSKWLVETIMAHPDVQGLRRWILLTRDAHELYKKSGWTAIKDPARWMELHNKDVYRKKD